MKMNSNYGKIRSDVRSTHRAVFYPLEAVSAQTGVPARQQNFGGWVGPANDTVSVAILGFLGNILGDGGIQRL